MKAEPILKWAGGKRQLLPRILPLVPADIDTYYEPFAGGLALFFALANEGRFKRAVIGDANPVLVNLYTQLRDSWQAVSVHLFEHARRNAKSYFYEQRACGFLDIGAEGAARTIYLNRTCFNGLYRVNKSGFFNVPFGNYSKPKIENPGGLYAAHLALQGVRISLCDFSMQVRRARAGDFVYFDPPYVPASSSANFTAYHKDGFTADDQQRVADTMGAAVERGARVLLSNSDTEETRRIFMRPGWQLEALGVRRNINCKGAKRGAVGEILVSA